MAFIDGGNGCRCKKIKTLRARSKCPPPGSRAGGRKSRSTGPCRPSNSAAFHCVSSAAPSCQVSVFGSFLCGNVCAICASVWSCFSSSCVCGKHNQREKSMYPEAMKKSIAFIESIFSPEWCRNSQFCLAAIYDIYERSIFSTFIYSSFIISWTPALWIITL